MLRHSHVGGRKRKISHLLLLFVHQQCTWQHCYLCPLRLVVNHLFIHQRMQINQANAQNLNNETKLIVK